MDFIVTEKDLNVLQNNSKAQKLEEKPPVSLQLSSNLLNFASLSWFYETQFEISEWLELST